MHRIPQKTCEMVTRDTTPWAVCCQRKSVKISRFERGFPFQEGKKGMVMVGRYYYRAGLPEGTNFGKVILRFF